MSKKFLIKVLDGGCFVDFTRGGKVAALPHRPYVVEESVYFRTAVANGRLGILGEVKENCTDDQFHRFYANEKDKDKAVARYLKEKSPVAVEATEAPAKSVQVAQDKPAETAPAKSAETVQAVQEGNNK